MSVSDGECMIVCLAPHSPPRSMPLPVLLSTAPVSVLRREVAMGAVWS